MKKFVLLLMVFALCMSTTSAEACFCVQIGKDASPTGYPMVIHNEDNGTSDEIKHYWVPAKDWPAGSFMQQTNPVSGTTGRSEIIPQVPRTNGFFYSDIRQPFDSSRQSSCGMLNEYGVSVASNACSSAITATMAVNDPSGGIHWGIRRAAAERATSSRHAVEVVAGLLDKWGYADSGRTYTFGDRNEIWVVHITRGQQYMAIRIPDDHIGIMPNHHTTDNPRDYLPGSAWGGATASYDHRPDLFTFARANRAAAFPAASADADFNWRRFALSGSGAIAGSISTGDTRRQAAAEYFLLGFPLSDDMASTAWHTAKMATGKGFKVSNKAPAKVTMEQIFKTYTCHYEGTDWGTGRPNANYHAGGPCSNTTNESKIFQFHPDVRLTTLWVALGRPCQMTYTPIHPLAYGEDIENMVPDAVQFPASEGNYRLDNHLRNLGDNKLFKGQRQDYLRRFQYMMNSGYGIHLEAVKEMNLNYLKEMFEANLALIATNPTNEELAAFDRAASDKVLAMWQKFSDERPLFNIPAYTTAEYIDRNDATQSSFDIIFELPAGKVPSATGFNLSLIGNEFTVATPTANVYNPQHLGGGKWTARVNKATITEGTGVNVVNTSTTALPGLYQFILRGQTTGTPTEYFSATVLLNMANGPVSLELAVTPIDPFEVATKKNVPYVPPAAQTVTITNSGTSSAILEQPTATYFEISKLVRNVILPGESMTFSVQPKAGLPIDSYLETIKIVGKSVANSEVFEEIEAEFIIDQISRKGGNCNSGFLPLALILLGVMPFVIRRK